MKKLMTNSLLILYGILLSFILLELFLQISSSYVELKQLNKNKIFPEEDIVILALGESTTTDLLNGQGSWPGELQNILNNNSIQNRTYHVINEGVPGVNSLQILIRLDKLLDKYDPDIVIFMIGINDYETQEYNYRFERKRQLKTIKLFSILKEEYYKKFNNIFKKRCKDQRIDNNSELMELINSINIENNKSTKDALIKLESENNCNLYHYIGVEYQKLAISKNNIRNTERNTTEIVYFFNKSTEYLDKYLDYYPNDYVARSNLGYSLFNIGDNSGNKEYYHSAKKELLKSIILSDKDSSTEWTISTYIRTCNKIGKNIEECMQKIKNYGYLSLSFNANLSQKEFTKENYIKIYDTLNKRNITIIAMQYPTKDILEIKEMLGKENVIYIENKENFYSALDEFEYSEIFIDSFARDFGHTTRLGNMLIAQNIASFIVNTTI